MVTRTGMSAARPVASPNVSIQVLVVDDDEVFTATVRALLEEANDG
jgi:hypothetical protein